MTTVPFRINTLPGDAWAIHERQSGEEWHGNRWLDRIARHGRCASARAWPELYFEFAYGRL